MTDGRRVLAFALVVAVAALGAVASPASALPETVGVSQGGTCHTVTPYGNGSQTVSEFYDYRNGTWEYSSYGTRDLQRTNTSQLLVYNGSEGLSLVILHGRLNDGAGDGGHVTFDVSGLPSDGEWVVEDDTYENRSDNFEHSGNQSHIDWFYAENRTDGAAFRGIAGGYSAITIDPGFNQDAHHWGDPSYPWTDGGTARWMLRTGPDGTVDLSMTDPVTVEPGCGGGAPNASLTVPAEAEAGANVTLDASGSTDDNGVVEYRWDVDGDGSNDATTTDPTYTHAYERTGNFTARVTAVDDAGQTDSARASITVSDTTPPEVSIQAPPSAETNETVTFSGENSSDNGRIESYTWEFGDGTTGSGATAGHQYSSNGTYTVNLTVTDRAGNNATESVTIDVRQADNGDPVARIDVPDTVQVGETVTISGENSSDDTRITDYEWELGDGTNATGATVRHAYESNGTYVITLGVTDRAGNTDYTTAKVEVTANQSDGNDDGGSNDGGSDDGGSSDGGSSDGGSSDGGSSGGDAGGSPDRDEPEGTQRLTRLADNVVELRASNVPAGEPVTADLPADASPDGVRFERVRLGHGGRIDSLRLRLRAAGGNRTIAGTDASPGALVVVGGSGLSATSEMAVLFSLPASTLGNGTDTSGVALYARDGGNWTRLPTEAVAETSDGRVRFRATAPSVRTVAVGVSGPVIAVESVSVPRRIAVDRPRTVSVTYRNRGSAPGTARAVLRAGNRSVDTARVQVPSGGTASARLRVSFEQTGTRTLRVAGRQHRVDVMPPEARVTVRNVTAPRRVQSGEEFEITARVTNDGNVPTNYTARLELFGEVVDRKTVRLQPGENRTVTFTRSVSASGNYTAVVGNASQQFAVAGEASGPTTETVGTHGQPGFDLLAAAVAISVAVLLRRRD